MADGHTVKKLAEKMGRDALGGIGHKGDDSFGFATLMPINRGASKKTSNTDIWSSPSKSHIATASTRC